MKTVTEPTHDLTPADRDLIAEARHCFRVDHRYAVEVLWAWHADQRRIAKGNAAAVAREARRQAGGSRTRKR